MTKPSRWISISIAFVCGQAYLVAAVLLLSTGHAWDPLSICLLAYPTVGAIIISSQPRNRIGWLLTVGGTAVALGQLAAAITYATLDSEPERWQEVMAWLANTLFIGGFEGLVIAMALLFPTGRALSSRWRVIGTLVLIIYAASTVLLAFRPGSLLGYFADRPELINPFGIGAFGKVIRFFDPVSVPLIVTVILTSLVAMFMRWRRSRGVERLQLQWFALAIGLLGMSLLVSGLMKTFAPTRSSWFAAAMDTLFFIAATLGTSVAIGIAILRYHLYDIERLINRTLVYTLVTTLLVASFSFSVILFQFAASPFTRGNDLAVGGSTLLVFVLFRPIRQSIQSFVDRRFYRQKYDVEKALQRFGVTTRDAVDLDQLLADLTSIVGATIQPTNVSIWLRAETPRKDRT